MPVYGDAQLRRFRRDLVLSLALPLCYNDLKNLSLVSRSLSSHVRPYLLRDLKPITTADLASQTCLQLLLSESGWKYAEFVRSVTIYLNGVDPCSRYSSPEHVVAAILSRLPHLLNITLIPQFELLGHTPSQNSNNNFDCIATTIAGLSRLRSLSMSGTWPGGRAAMTQLLHQAGAPLQNLQLTISDDTRDPLFCTALISRARLLRSLRIHEPMNAGAIADLVRALPRPDRLRELRISILNVSDSDEPWYRLGFWDALSGLEELYVSGPWLWRDFDHSGDSAPSHWHTTLQHVASPRDTGPERRDDAGNAQSFLSFLVAHPSLRALYVKCSTAFLPWQRAALPHFQNLREAYQNRILMDIAPDSREDWMVEMLVDGLDDFQLATRWLSDQQRSWFLGRQVDRVRAWAKNVREQVVFDAVAMASIAPALEQVRWMPYKEDVTLCPWPGAECGDGDFVFDIIVRRPSQGLECSAADVEIGGGIRRVARIVQSAGVAASRDPADIPFGGHYDVTWIAEEHTPSPVPWA